MNYLIKSAKNGELTLSLNNVYIYSKYNPVKDASKFIEKEYDYNSKGYILVGLGLGYHLEALLELEFKKKIIVIPLDKGDISLFKKYAPNPSIVTNNNVKIIKSEITQKELMNYKIIIPNPWLKAIECKHPLFTFLEDIKIRQISHKSYGNQMELNFNENIKNKDISVKHENDKYKGHIACLVASGPSLDKSLKQLEAIRKDSYILCVGSALRILLANNIEPNAVIITDCQESVIDQIKNINFKGKLYYLSTANHNVVKLHNGKREIIFQKGFMRAERIANQMGEPTLETGGSVATTGVSLLDYLGFKTVILFGQDLGFKQSRTHAINSTSGKPVLDVKLYRKIIANNDEYINTTSNLHTYLRWFEYKSKNTSLKMFNTALEGAKIEGIPYVKPEELMRLVFPQEKESSECKEKN